MSTTKAVYTMITRHGTSSGVTAYTLIAPNYTTETITSDNLLKALSAGKIDVINLAVKDGKIVSTNGAIDKYTLIADDGSGVIGTARAVILNRVEKDGKLIGYTVFTHTGSLAELNVSDAVILCNKKLISNGKIMHTTSGDIVAAIAGTYPLREIKVTEAPKGKTTLTLFYFGSIVGIETKYFGAVVSCTSAAEMSKIFGTLSTSNSKVIAAAKKIGGDEIRNELGIKRVGANSFYGVFSISALDKMIKDGVEITCPAGKFIVAATKYDDERHADEATVTLNKQFKVIDQSKSEDNPSLDTKVKSYAKAITDKFNGITIK